MGFGPSGGVIALRRAKGRPDRRAVSHVVIVPARIALPREGPHSGESAAGGSRGTYAGVAAESAAA